MSTNINVSTTSNTIADTEGLPLFELFTQLRKAGLPLGVGEYFLLLKALQGGFGTQDRTSLKALCQALWIKSNEETIIFNHYFEEIVPDEESGADGLVEANEESAALAQEVKGKFNRNQWLGNFRFQLTSNTKKSQRRKKYKAFDWYLQISRFLILGGLVTIVGTALYPHFPPLQVPKSSPSATPKASPTLNPSPLTLPETAVIPSPTADQEQEPSTNRINLNLLTFSILGLAVLVVNYFVINHQARKLVKLDKKGDAQLFEITEDFDTEFTQQQQREKAQIARALQANAIASHEIVNSISILALDRFPISPRQMKQSWRYLRQLVRTGIPTELDIEATAKKWGEQGFLLEPILVPRRRNRAELVLLVDQEGSMTPFHALSQQLAETAIRGGRLSRTDIYYFHNCPVDCLYLDRAHYKPEPIDQIIDQLRPEKTVVLIFSDAGAARGGFNQERVDITRDFLLRLKRKVRYISWLNPVPHTRWNETSANEIANMVPMFALSRRGLDHAIGILRGKSTTTYQ